MHGKPLPASGEVFLVPLGHGLFSFCWVAGHAEVLNGGDFITYAMATWVGKKPPLESDLDAREVLMLSQPGEEGKPHVRKMSEAPPRSWKRLGTISSPARGVPKPISYSACESFAWVALREWQWRNDRKQRDVDDAAEAREIARDQEANDTRARMLREKRRTSSLASLGRSKDILFEWDGLVRTSDRTAVETILRETARVLAKATKPAEKKKVLEAGFERVNAWNDRRNVIETPEREALIDAFDDVAHAAGLRVRDIGKNWRDW
ncbi:MAG: hypothetical protein IPQ07_18205 [Myxococcales bacterium]|nr:hypothetical protein [Myxococcales bacterium]